MVRICGERLTTVFDSWKVVKEGKILAVLEGKGRFLSAEKERFSGEGIRFELRLSLTAGKPWLDLGFRFINCTEGDLKPDDIIFQVKASADSELSLDSPVPFNTLVDSTGCGDTKGTTTDQGIVTTTGIKELKNFDIPWYADEVFARSIVGKSNYRTDFKIGIKGQQVENIITAETLAAVANEHFAEVMFGTFFADFTDPAQDFGVCATVFQAFQNFFFLLVDR